MVNAVSALLVACVVGLVWFLRKEFELWYEHRQAAEAETRAISKELFSLKIKLHEVGDSFQAQGVVREIGKLFVAHMELNNSHGGRTFFAKWLYSGTIEKALFSRDYAIWRKALQEFESELTPIVPLPIYPRFPLRRLWHVQWAKRSRPESK